MCFDCKDFIEEGSNILDLGCGSGIVADEFGKFFKAKIVGADIKDQRVKKIPFAIIDGFHLPFPQDFFDVVLINYVLHHTKDPTSLLEEAKRVSKEKIIIYEDLPEGFLSKLICQLHYFSYNFLFQKSRESKINFRDDKNWKDVFNDIKLKLVFEKEISSFPIKKKLFILEKPRV